MMEKQTTCKSSKNGIAKVITMLCFMSTGFAQNLTMTLAESWDGTEWENAFKSENTYDANDYLVGTLAQLWTDPPGQWENGARETYTNNPTGAATQILSEIWDGDSSEWWLYQRTTNVVNGSDQVLTSTTEIWNSIAWMNQSRDTYTYSGGFLTSALFETWDFFTNTWVNNALTTYTNNPNGSVSQAVFQTWDPVGNGWENTSRSTYTYNGADQVLTELDETWATDTWLNDSRTTNTYTGGWLTYTLSELWSMPSGTWENDSQSFYTNNPDGTPAQIVIQQWDFGGDTLILGTNLWVNSARITYTYEGLGVDDTSKNRVALYPNPAQDFINVKSDEYLNAFSIIDQHGRIVKSGQLSEFESSVDISGLSSGMYFLQVGEDRKSTLKLIKQ